MQENKPGLFGLWPTERCCAIKSDIATLRTMFNLKRAWQAIKTRCPLWVQTHKQGIQRPSDGPSHATIPSQYLSSMENGSWLYLESCFDLGLLSRRLLHSTFLRLLESNLLTPAILLLSHRTEIKGGGLQATSSSQFSVPAFGSTNFLDPRKLLRTVLSGS